ncbi:MAG TPA: helix-turn-helix domain-containing protein [Thermoanaerobaculia bacterium]
MKPYKLLTRNDATGAIWVYELLYDRGRIAAPYFHDRPELVIVLCGEISMVFDGVQRQLRRGDVVFLAIGVVHRDVIVTEPARVFRCTVNAELFARAAFEVPVTVIRSELLEGALSRLITEARMDDAGMPLALEAAALAVLAAAHRGRDEVEAKLLDAIRLVRDTDDTLSEIASRCGYYDQAHLTRTFRRQLGVPPAEYRRRHRFPAR